jgi:aryl-phospho-beta-D-glucosidase BglC (GH1 family)
MTSRTSSLALLISSAALLAACSSELSEPSDEASGAPVFTGAVMPPPGAGSNGNLTGNPAPSTPAPTGVPEVTTPSLQTPVSMPAVAASAWVPPAAIDPNTPVGLHGQLHVQGTALVDKSGSPVQLKGISTMWLNWEDRYSTSKTGLQWMRDNWKVSVFRAAMGVEPDGAYLSNPEQALTRLRQVVHNAIDLGVYVIIDWHDHHANENQAAAVAFFSKIAAEFGQFPNVLYETFNEPEQADWSTQIKPYHEAVLPAIRSQDPDGVVILGSRQWSQRVDEAALDPVSGTNLMYTVHFYACDHREQQRGEAQVAYDAGLALFVTEWGATPADGGAAQPTVCVPEAQAWHDWMNERKISWAAWKLDGCDDSSCLFNSESAPADGGWTDQWLNGHAKFVVERLLN